MPGSQRGRMPTPSKQDFNAAYVAHQPLEIQHLLSVDDPDQAAALAQTLTGKGYLIDVPIMVWHWDPFETMRMRIYYGYTWVPSLGGAPVQTAPGLSSIPGLMPYDPANRPPASIKVSLDLGDYPPYVVLPPPGPAPQPVMNMVGKETVKGMFEALWPAPQKFMDGSMVTQDGKTYLFHRPSAFGLYWWTTA